MTAEKIKLHPLTLKRVAVFLTEQHMGDCILAIPTTQAMADYA